MLGNAAEYSPPRRGAVDAPLIKWIRSEIGAAGVVGSAKLFRPKHFAELTTITASRYRAPASRPAVSASVAAQHFLDDAATLLLLRLRATALALCGGDARRGITHPRNSFTPS